jgi:peroxiredoxin
VDAALLGARLVLAAVFAVAGVAKLLDRPGAREALAGFGLSARLATPLSVALPVVELSVAAALVPRAFAWWAALGALGLLLAFTAVIARSLARGERPPCRCFGQLRAATVGWRTLARNGALAALAAFVIGAGWSDPGGSAVGWLGALAPAERTLAVLGLGALALLAAVVGLLARLLAQQARVLTRLDAIEARLEDGIAPSLEREEARPPDKGLPVGAPAPAFTLPGLDGEPRSLAALLEPGRPVVLLFAALGCDPCSGLVPEIVRWQREHAEAFTLALVSSGSVDDNRAKFGVLAPGAVLLQAGSEVADAYASQWTPGSVLIGPAGRIASPVAYGDAAIRALVAHAAAAPGVPHLGAQPPAPGVPNDPERRGSLPVLPNGPPRPGSPSPPVVLPDLDGRTVDLQDYRGRDTLVVFWQPSCPHCQRLADDLRRWEAEPPRGAPRLLVVSSGSIEANRDLGFQSTVVLDEGFAVGKAFGVRGTPSAVLVDAQGRIASTVGVGARDILALAGVVPIVGSPGALPPLA